MWGGARGILKYMFSLWTMVKGVKCTCINSQCIKSLNVNDVHLSGIIAQYHMDGFLGI